MGLNIIVWLLFCINTVLTWTPHLNALLLSLWALAIVAIAFPIIARESIDCKDVFRTLGWFSSAWLGQITVIIFWTTHMCGWHDLMGRKKNILVVTSRPINGWDVDVSNDWKQWVIILNVFLVIFWTISFHPFNGLMQETGIQNHNEATLRRSFSTVR